MAKKTRMGKDPLSWIKDSRERTEDSKQSKQELQSKHSLQTAEEDITRRAITKTSQEGLKEGWTRATFIVREEYLEKLKDLAYWDRKQVKELMDVILGSYLKGKELKPRPR